MKFIGVLKKNKLMFVVGLIYILLMIFMPTKAASSAKNSIYYIIEMLQIMPVILVLTALIEAWIPRKVIINNFGKNTGAKGIILSFILGSVSAGPIYAAFPVCKTLLNKGASISNIVIILSAWAVVKVPMLANEAKFLGVQFMFVRWILTSISIIIMGFLVSSIVKEKDLKLENDIEKSNNHLLHIRKQYCIGCGICTRVQPDIFELMNNKAVIKTTDSTSMEYLSKAKEASDKCPVGAIIITP